MKTFFVVLLFLLVLAGGAGTSYYFYSKYQDAKIKLDNPQQTAQDEVNRIVSAMGKIIELPSDEAPSVASVLDKDKLKDQAFFAKAENGDKVVIYSKAMKAILYRESINKVIEVAPIVMNQPEASATPKATPKPSVEPSPEPTQ